MINYNVVDDVGVVMNPMLLKGQILSLDGKTAFESQASGSDPLALGRQVGEDLAQPPRISLQQRGHLGFDQADALCACASLPCCAA